MIVSNSRQTSSYSTLRGLLLTAVGVLVVVVAPAALRASDDRLRLVVLDRVLLLVKVVVSEASEDLISNLLSTASSRLADRGR